MKPRLARRRKNFLPTFIFALIFWGTWIFIFLKIPPETNLSLVIFHLSFFLAVFLTSALIFANSRLGFLVALFFNLFLLFRYFQIGNILNLALLAGIFVALGLYFANQS